MPRRSRPTSGTRRSRQPSISTGISCPATRTRPSFSSTPTWTGRTPVPDSLKSASEVFYSVLGENRVHLRAPLVDQPVAKVLVEWTQPLRGRRVHDRAAIVVHQEDE